MVTDYRRGRPTLAFATERDQHLETRSHAAEDREFLRVMRVTNGHLLLLIRGGLDTEAYRVATQQSYLIGRRERQSSGGDVA
jgi:hypothetical protein